MDFAETAAALLTAHLLGDFVLQTNWMYEKKRHIGVLALHVSVVTALTALLIGGLHPIVLPAIFVSHLMMDAVKTYAMTDDLSGFLSDQFVHLGVIVAVAMAVPDAVSHGWWGELRPDAADAWFAGLALTSGVILAVPAGGVLVQKATTRFVAELADTDIAGLPGGGKTIGHLERGLIFLLVLGNATAGVGFLVAAKSILRFGDISDARQRKVAEYIIIGTFLSFGWGLLIAGLTQRAVRLWL